MIERAPADRHGLVPSPGATGPEGPAPEQDPAALAWWQARLAEQGGQPAPADDGGSVLWPDPR